MSSSSPDSAPSSARSGSTSWSVFSGYCSGWARRSSPPVANPSPGNGGDASVVSVRAPGQAASTARSTIPAGTTAGTQMAMPSPPGPAVSSKPRWGWVPNSSSPGRTEEGDQVGPQGRRAPGDPPRGEPARAPTGRGRPSRRAAFGAHAATRDPTVNPNQHRAGDDPDCGQDMAPRGERRRSRDGAEWARGP